MKNVRLPRIARQLVWFAALWVSGVAAVSMVAFIIRAMVS